MAPTALSFADEVAIVTGAGCRESNEVGNGRAAAILLARHGAKVAVVDLNLKWAQDTQRIIADEGGTALAIQADVSVDASCSRIVTETVAALGSPTLLVNNGTVTLSR
jgi:NAD(P)-dependent dehydrogenase (short-subunit alcohol dehydrogenase family)